MNVLTFVAGYLPGFKSGGPVKTLSNLVAALGDEFDFYIVCLDRDLGDKLPYGDVAKGGWNEQGKASVFYVEPGITGLVSICKIIRRGNFDVVYLNSFFSFRFSIFPLLLLKILRSTKPVLLGPRGEFSPGALAIRATKKRLFLALSKMSGIYKDVVWHASTEYERSDIERVFGESVEVRTAIDLSVNSSGELPIPRARGNPLKIVFVSRISEKKNLLGALKILQRVRGNVLFDVYGPIENEAYWQQCLLVVDGLPKHVRFNYCGSLQPAEVLPTLVKYDLFLFPTFGENFGHVIAEALLVGLPALISNTTPWRRLWDRGLGWDIPIEQEERFALCIDECCEKSEGDYFEWRANIRSWAVANIGNAASVEENRLLFSNL